MDILEASERTIENRPPEQPTDFRRWFAEFDGALWGVQIKSDTAVKNPDALTDEAVADYQSGEEREAHGHSR